MKSIIELKPEQYSSQERSDKDGPILCFEAKSSKDFDWLEQMILENNYYESDQHIWSYKVDHDKRIMAELISNCLIRDNQSVLELGCSNGTILKLLKDQGYLVRGLDISQKALDNAHISVKENISLVDLLEFNCNDRFDLIFGLDIFEHLNPNKLPEYLNKIKSLLKPEGLVLANIPAFGQDKVFGEVFPIYLESWLQDYANGRHFQMLHVDGNGYPINGHLIWADTDWWCRSFSQTGLTRLPQIEQALQCKFSTYLSKVLPRKSIYLFGSNNDGSLIRVTKNTVTKVPQAITKFADDFESVPGTKFDPTDNDNIFIYGWHRPEVSETGLARWMNGTVSYININCVDSGKLKLFLEAHNPDVNQNPVTVEINYTGGKRSVALGDQLVKVTIPIRYRLTIIQIYISHTWNPHEILKNGDTRNLGIFCKHVRLTASIRFMNKKYIIRKMKTIYRKLRSI